MLEGKTTMPVKEKFPKKGGQEYLNIECFAIFNPITLLQKKTLNKFIECRSLQMAQFNDQFSKNSCEALIFL